MWWKVRCMYISWHHNPHPQPDPDLHPDPHPSSSLVLSLQRWFVCFFLLSVTFIVVPHCFVPRQTYLNPHSPRSSVPAISKCPSKRECIFRSRRMHDIRLHGFFRSEVLWWWWWWLGQWSKTQSEAPLWSPSPRPPSQNKNPQLAGNNLENRGGQAAFHGLKRAKIDPEPHLTLHHEDREDRVNLHQDVVAGMAISRICCWWYYRQDQVSLLRIHRRLWPTVLPLINMKGRVLPPRNIDDV